MKSYNGFYLVGQYPENILFKKALEEGLQFFDFAEIGIPFSDPVADGPVISAAAGKVLEKGFRFQELLQSIKDVRSKYSSQKKIYWMTYANILYHHRFEDFLRRSRNAGINGIIIPDIPFIESGKLKMLCRRYDMQYIHFATPENTEEQIRTIASAAEGFLYFVSIRGVTGSRLEIDSETAQKIKLARKYSPVPVVLGFGIKDRESSKKALELADGFIAGTALVESLENHQLTDFSAKCRELTGAKIEIQEQ